jgi:hypothetical protein
MTVLSMQTFSKSAWPAQLSRIFFPDAESTPAGKAFEDAIPMAKTIGQATPLGGATQNPQNRLKKLATGGLTAYPNADNLLQICQQLAPFPITQFAFIHVDQNGRDSTFALCQQSLATNTGKCWEKHAKERKIKQKRLFFEQLRSAYNF